MTCGNDVVYVDQQASILNLFLHRSSINVCLNCMLMHDLTIDNVSVRVEVK